jgi:hypothetical protein
VTRIPIQASGTPGNPFSTLRRLLPTNGGSCLRGVCLGFQCRTGPISQVLRSCLRHLYFLIRRLAANHSLIKPQPMFPKQQEAPARSILRSPKLVAELLSAVNVGPAKSPKGLSLPRGPSIAPFHWPVLLAPSGARQNPRPETEGSRGLASGRHLPSTSARHHATESSLPGSSRSFLQAEEAALPQPIPGSLRCLPCSSCRLKTSPKSYQVLSSVGTSGLVRTVGLGLGDDSAASLRPRWRHATTPARQEI